MPVIIGSDVAAVVLLGSYFGGSYLRNRKIEKSARVKQLSYLLYHVLKDKPSTVIPAITIGASRNIDPVKTKRIKEILPIEMMKYRYLMHPVRLSIMKVLQVEGKMTSVQLKEGLELSWSTYRNHLLTMEKGGYVNVLNEFNQLGNLAQFVEITGEGEHEYNILIDLLEQFLADPSYDDLFQVNPEITSEKSMYPENIDVQPKDLNQG